MRHETEQTQNRGTRRFWRILGIGLVWLLVLANAQAATREKLDIVVVLDNSGSMHREGKKPGNDEQFMRVTAVQYLLEKMAPGDRAALVTFDTDVHTDPQASQLRDVAETGMKEAFANGIRQIAAKPNGSTNMAAGLRAAAAIFDKTPANGHKRFLVFLTDGTPNPPHGDNTPVKLAEYANSRFGNHGIGLHTVGLGELSANPGEAKAAQDLLDTLARNGGGASHRAAHAGDLPPLFGTIFAQLVGHEVTRTVPAGTPTTFAVAPGTHNLRVLATNDNAAPKITLTDPQGRPYDARSVSPLLPEQTAFLAANGVTDPVPGAWKVQTNAGSLELAWEASFEATLTPPGIRGVPARAHLPLRVTIHERGKSEPKKLTQGRVVAEYALIPDGPRTVLPLAEDTKQSGVWTGDLPDSGAVGDHAITIRCYQQGDNGEEEGGPDYAQIHVARLASLKVLAPEPNASFALPGPIPVRVSVMVEGEPDTKGEWGVWANDTNLGRGQTRLIRQADGTYAGVVPVGSQTGPDQILISVARPSEGISADDTARVPITLVPHPTVILRWNKVAPATLPVNPDGTQTLTAHVASSASTPQQIRLACAGLASVSVEPATLSIAPNQPDKAVSIRLHWHNAAPHDYSMTLSPSLAANDADLEATSLTEAFHVRTWLERNRWWFYPAVALLILSALLGTFLTTRYLREQARRNGKMRDVLNGVAVYVPGVGTPYKPAPQTVLTRRFYTFGGKGADVFIPDPKNPGQTLFDGPRIRVGVAWNRKARKPELNITREGADTMFYDRDNNLLSEALVPTEGGSLFYVDPEHILVSVQSEWTS